MGQNNCCGNNSSDLMIVAQTTEVPVCKNPLLYLIEMAAKNASVNGSTIAAELTTILNNGFYTLNKAMFCCPDCEGADSFYFLGSEGALSDLITNMIAWTSYVGPIPCCLNSFSPASVAGNIQRALETLDITPECCDSDFDLSISQTLTAYPSLSAIYDMGIVEISAFSSKSLFSQIAACIKAANKYAVESEILAVYQTIMNSGVMIKCSDCALLVSNSTNGPSLIQQLLV